jgi:predicted transcriptional regulator of viral defense system
MPEGGRKTQPGVAFFGQPHPDEAIAGLAVGQHAIVGLAQLTDLGLSGAAVRKRVTVGRLHCIHQAVYSLVPRELLTREGHWMAAVLACGPGAALSHRSAAALLGLRSYGGAKIDVTVPGRSGRQRDGIKLHRSTTLTAVDTASVKNIPCTTVSRTLLDLAELLDRRALERAFDESEVLELFDLRALNDQLRRNRTRPGVERVRAILAEHYIGTTATQSDLEEAFLALCRRIGIPDPLVNEWVDLGDGERAIWADFVWRRQRVIVETDGRRFHSSHQARERDTRRDQRATLAGWKPIRTTWRQVMNRPHELEPTLAKLVSL